MTQPNKLDAKFSKITVLSTKSVEPQYPFRSPIKTITKAKIRAGSSTTTSQVAIVSAGVPLSVYETTEDGTWHKIGLTGYIYHELLKPVP